MLLSWFWFLKVYTFFLFRSLFVPYFKHLRDGCVVHLTDHEDTVGSTQKKKKMKLQAGSTERSPVSRKLTLEAWHLRALILSYLHNCFLYATGNLEFPKPENFQASTYLSKQIYDYVTFRT